MCLNMVLTILSNQILNINIIKSKCYPKTYKGMFYWLVFNKVNSRTLINDSWYAMMWRLRRPRSAIWFLVLESNIWVTPHDSREGNGWRNPEMVCVILVTILLNLKFTVTPKNHLRISNTVKLVFTPFIYQFVWFQWFVWYKH